MIKAKYIFLIILSEMLSTALSAQTAEEIIEMSRAAVKISSFEAVSTLTITDSRGNERIRTNTMASKTFGDNSEKRIIKFLSPPEVKGTGILIIDHEQGSDDMWIYLPALRKTRRIVSSEKSKGFMGSEFSNADMTAPSISDFSYELTGSATIEGTECWEITGTPISIDLEDEYGYSKFHTWIGKNDYIVRTTDYYDFDGEKFKSIRTLEFKLLDPDRARYMITEMSAQNFTNGRSSRMKMEKIQISDTNDEYFTVSYLER